MSDQLVAETSTWQNTTLTTDKRPCPPPGGSRRAAADLRLRPRGHWDLQCKQQKWQPPSTLQANDWIILLSCRRQLQFKESPVWCTELQQNFEICSSIPGILLADFLCVVSPNTTNKPASVSLQPPNQECEGNTKMPLEKCSSLTGRQLSWTLS